MLRRRKRAAHGEKHRLIFARHSLTRLFRNLLFATLIIWLVWWIAPYTPGPFRPPNDVYLFWAGTIFLAVTLLVFLMRRRGFIQARNNHILLALPLFRLRIPYSHVENVRMTKFKDIYDREKMSWSEKRFLSPYLPKTVSTISLNNFPVSEWLLRLFLPSYIFLPRSKGKGFVIYVDQYLQFNTEVDSRLNAARAAGTAKPPADDEVEFDGYFDLVDE